MLGSGPYLWTELCRSSVIQISQPTRIKTGPELSDAVIFSFILDFNSEGTKDFVKVTGCIAFRMGAGQLFLNVFMVSQSHLTGRDGIVA